MKKYFIISLLVLSVSLYSQNQFIGAKGGLSFTSVSGFLSDASSRRMSYTLGMSYEYQMNNNFLLGADLLYQQKGYSDYLLFADENGIPQGSGRLNYSFNYLSLPIKAGYIYGNKFSGFAYLGFVPAFLTDAYYQASDTEGVLDDSSEISRISAKDYTAKFELSGLAEIGANYQMSHRFLLTTAFTALYGLTHITNYGNSENTMRNMGIFLTFGVKYALSQKE